MLLCLLEVQSQLQASPASSLQQQQQQQQQTVAKAQAAEEVWSKVKFSFTIESITLDLYTGDSNLVRQTALCRLIFRGCFTT